MIFLILVWGVGHGTRVQDIYLDLRVYEMRCYIAVHRRKLAIDLESELSVALAIALYSLAPNRMAHRISNAQIRLLPSRTL